MGRGIFTVSKEFSRKCFNPGISEVNLINIWGKINTLKSHFQWKVEIPLQKPYFKGSFNLQQIYTVNKLKLSVKKLT